MYDRKLCGLSQFGGKDWLAAAGEVVVECSMYSVPTTTAIKKEGKRGEEKTRTNMKTKIKHKI